MAYDYIQLTEQGSFPETPDDGWLIYKDDHELYICTDDDGAGGGTDYNYVDLEPQASAPEAPSEGCIYYKTDDNLYVYADT